MNGKVVEAYDKNGKLVKRRWPDPEIIGFTVRQLESEGYRVAVKEWREKNDKEAAS